MIANSFFAGTFVGIDIVLNSDARKMYLSQATRIEQLLEQEFAGIISGEHFKRPVDQQVTFDTPVMIQ